MISELTLDDINYPSLLRDIPDPPDKIYYKGNLQRSMFMNCLGVVGSRKMTPYGNRVVEFLLKGLCSFDITIVSGFMYGVDAAAHDIAIKLGMRTIAVMPCGVSNIYPRDQKDLYHSIIDNNGLVISEFRYDISPKKWVFPKRNRIVAGLCKALLVIEADENSGSLITSGIANDYGRKIFGVPGSIFSDLSKGTNKIINDYAEAVTSSEDILREYYHKMSPVLCDNVPIDDNISTETKIISLLNSQPCSLSELCIKIDQDPQDTSTILMRMEISGLIKEEKGIYYVR